MINLPLFSSSLGLDNKTAPHRLPYNPDAGISGLELADNFIIDKTGELASRRKTTLLTAGELHSLYPFNGRAVVVQDRVADSSIYVADVNESLLSVELTGIRLGLAKGYRFDFCNANGTLYYTNGYVNGMIDSGFTSWPWKESAWPDADTHVDFKEVPPANHLAYNAGRIYFSIGEVLYYTEFGHLGIYDAARNGEHLPGRIVMIIPAADGMYVSTEESIYFLTGLDPHEWTSRKVFNKPAIEWGQHAELVDPSFFGFETNTPSALIGTTTGPCICLPSGSIVNLIDKKVEMAGCKSSGAICLYDESLIVQTGE